MGQLCRTVRTVIQSACIAENTVLCDVQFGAVYQTYTAEDARAGIPAGVWLHTRVYRDGQAIFLSKIQVGRNAHREGDIAVVL